MRPERLNRELLRKMIQTAKMPDSDAEGTAALMHIAAHVQASGQLDMDEIALISGLGDAKTKLHNTADFLEIVLCELFRLGDAARFAPDYVRPEGLPVE